jgi:L-alanine-DL-glutamate epimerase-like enolase superfamily enzyme
MFPEPDVSNCGGVTPWMKVAHPGRVPTISRLPPTECMICMCIFWPRCPTNHIWRCTAFGLERYIARPAQAIVDGFASPPERPGHGVEFDWEALEAMRDSG